MVRHSEGGWGDISAGIVKKAFLICNSGDNSWINVNKVVLRHEIGSWNDVGLVMSLGCLGVLVVWDVGSVSVVVGFVYSPDWLFCPVIFSVRRD